MDCDRPKPLWLEAQAVPTASAVPYLNPLPPGWILGSANIRNGWSRLTLDHDRIGRQALVVELTATCDIGDAVPRPAVQAATQRYERAPSAQGSTWYTVFPGGIVTRDVLDQTLDRRSDGRLHLDPP